ncbi:response regulator [Chelativorans sp. AA-79]|uniref:response regulator n=1 Tax=Chelativorans sp. AA-79 TaxID=3028735 RepID=UPI0023F88484|nr:response regulator [Chelativorans sp. AA-79]WEX11324.1 response regulator [Chelativorans sp. AA-79]
MSSDPNNFDGLRIFIVEDEALVAMNLEMILEDLGCLIVGPAMRFDRAEAMIGGELAADVAILDVNVGGRQVFPLAHRLEGRMPIIFATGYDQTGIPAEWHGRPMLQKPYTSEDVARALTRVLDGR